MKKQFRYRTQEEKHRDLCIAIAESISIAGLVGLFLVLALKE